MVARMPETATEPSLLAPVRRTFRAAAEAILPATTTLDEAGWATVERVVESALAQRPRKAQRQIVMFLRVLSVYPLLRHRRRFAELPRDRRERILHGLERGRHVLLRRGVWGLRTLVFMGYYTQPVHAASIGYRASPRGWRAIRGTGHTSDTADRA